MSSTATADKLTFSPTSDITAFVANIGKLNDLRTGIKLDGLQGEVKALFSKVGTNAVEVGDAFKAAPSSIDKGAVSSSVTSIA
jgi:hypothetical protein